MTFNPVEDESIFFFLNYTKEIPQTGCNYGEYNQATIIPYVGHLGAMVAEWLSIWLAEQEVWGSIPGLAT